MVALIKNGLEPVRPVPAATAVLEPAGSCELMTLLGEAWDEWLLSDPPDLSGCDYTADFGTTPSSEPTMASSAAAISTLNTPAHVYNKGDLEVTEPLETPLLARSKSDELREGLIPSPP